jgi:UDP-GlcNAc3NAcA epimerase
VKVLTVVGARPQFIKASPVCRAFAEAGIDEYLVHTGQHYDAGMSQVFFDELEIPHPNINLGIGSASHGEQTGQMLIALEKAMQKQNPDVVLVYGDTNSTLAGALAAIKLRVPIAHVEAGLRSFNRDMPEEHNRVITDHCSDILFCPTATAVANLASEGITEGVHQVGDTMYDAVLHFREVARERSVVLDRVGLESGGYLMLTAHRPGNVDAPPNLRGILEGVLSTGEIVIFPIHPRTRSRLNDLDGDLAPDRLPKRLRLIDPLGYLDTIRLLESARVLLTDSGGMQKEAYWLGTPCVTLREETEWVETVEDGANTLVGADPKKIAEAASISTTHATTGGLYGDGDAAGKIVDLLSASRTNR